MPPIRQVPTSIKDANLAGYLRELRAAIGKTADKVEQALKPKTVTVDNPVTPPETPAPTLTDPSVVLTVSPTAPAPGVAFTLTAVVSGNSPTGKVRFLEGAEELSGSPVDLSAGQASIAVTVAEKGAHTYVAEYGGDTRNRSATSNSLTVEVGVSGSGDGLAPPAPTSLTATPDNWSINLAWTQPWTAEEPLADYLATEIWAKLAFPAWSGATEYFIGERVSYSGAAYRAKAGRPYGDADPTPDPAVQNVNRTPASGSAWWEVFTLSSAKTAALSGTYGVKVGEIAGLNFVFTGVGSELLLPDEPWSFWVRNADIEGLFSGYTGPETAKTLVTPERALQLLQGSIRETTLYKELGDDIGALREQWTIKVTDGEGLIGGIGLGVSSVSGTPTLDFGIRADRFWVASTESEYKKDLIPLETATVPRVVMTHTSGGTLWAYFCVASTTGLEANQWFRLRDICASNGTTELADYDDSFFIDHIGAVGGETSFPLVSNVTAANVVFFKPGTLASGYRRTTSEPLKTSRMIPPGAMPLIVTTSTRTYNGVSLAPGVYVNNAMILKATITEADIADGSITNAKIANAAITMAKIDKILKSSNYDGGVIASGPYAGYLDTTNVGTQGWAVDQRGTPVFNEVIVRSGKAIGNNAYIKASNMYALTWPTYVTTSANSDSAEYIIGTHVFKTEVGKSRGLILSLSFECATVCTKILVHVYDQDDNYLGTKELYNKRGAEIGARFFSTTTYWYVASAATAWKFSIQTRMGTSSGSWGDVELVVMEIQG